MWSVLGICCVFCVWSVYCLAHLVPLGWSATLLYSVLFYCQVKGLDVLNLGILILTSFGAVILEILKAESSKSIFPTRNSTEETRCTLHMFFCFTVFILVGGGGKNRG